MIWRLKRYWKLTKGYALFAYVVLRDPDGVTRRR